MLNFVYSMNQQTLNQFLWRKEISFSIFILIFYFWFIIHFFFFFFFLTLLLLKQYLLETPIYNQSKIYIPLTNGELLRFFVTCWSSQETDSNCNFVSKETTFSLGNEINEYNSPINYLQEMDSSLSDCFEEWERFFFFLFFFFFFFCLFNSKHK